MATVQNLVYQVLKFEWELEEGRVTECELQALCAVPRDAEPSRSHAPLHRGTDSSHFVNHLIKAGRRFFGVFRSFGPLLSKALRRPRSIGACRARLVALPGFATGSFRSALSGCLGIPGKLASQLAASRPRTRRAGLVS